MLRTLVLLVVCLGIIGCSPQSRARRESSVVPMPAPSGEPLVQPEVVEKNETPAPAGSEDPEVLSAQTVPLPLESAASPVSIQDVVDSIPPQPSSQAQVAASPTPDAPTQEIRDGKAWVAWADRAKFKTIERPLVPVGSVNALGDSAREFTFPTPAKLPLRPPNAVGMVFDIPGKLRVSEDLDLDAKGWVDNIPLDSRLFGFERVPVKLQFANKVTRINLSLSGLDRFVRNEDSQRIRFNLIFRDHTDGSAILILHLDFETTPFRTEIKEYFALKQGVPRSILDGNETIKAGSKSLKLMRVIDFTNHSEAPVELDVPARISGIIERPFSSTVPWSDYILCTNTLERESWVERRERIFTLIPLKNQGGPYQAGERLEALQPGESRRFGLYDEEDFVASFLEDTLQARYEQPIEVIESCAAADQSTFPLWNFKTKKIKSVMEAGPVTLKLNLAEPSSALLFPMAESVLFTPEGVSDVLPDMNWKGLERAQRYLNNAKSVLASSFSGERTADKLADALKNLSLAVTLAEGQYDDASGVQYEALYELARTLVARGRSLAYSEGKLQMKFYWLGQQVAQKAQAVSPETAEGFYYEALATAQIAVRLNPNAQLTGNIKRTEELLSDASDRNTKDNRPGDSLDGFGASRIKAMLQFTLNSYISMTSTLPKAVELAKKGFELDRNHAGNWYSYGMILVEKDSLRFVKPIVGCEVLKQLLQKNAIEMTSETPFEATIELEAARHEYQEECLALQSRS